MSELVKYPVDSLGEVLPMEQARVRELIKAYVQIGPPGRFAIMLMEKVLARTERAVMDGDLVQMICCYEELKALQA